MCISESTADTTEAVEGRGGTPATPDLGALPLAETVVPAPEYSPPSHRDRIVILGRRASGKTVYLSVLYERFWKSLDGLTMKAVSGAVHSDLIRTVDGLRSARWPPATLETQHCDLEIEYNQRKHLLVALDYAGELFRRAFVEDVTDSPEAEELVRHLDSAAAVMLLIDPAVAVAKDVDATIDDDFGMTQAVTRIRNWPGGRDIPFALVLTKADQNRELIRRAGGLERFVARHFPALARTLGKVYIFQVSAVQVETNAAGEAVPKQGYVPSDIERPLLHCLGQIDLKLEIAKQEARQRHTAHLADLRRKADQRAARKTTRTIIAVVVSMVIVAACAIALIWARKA